jgi:hypothetical protein
MDTSPNPSPQPSKTTNLIVLTGPMRSGTTLCGELLSKHPDVAFAPDTVVTLRQITAKAAEDTQIPCPSMNAKPSKAFLARWVSIAEVRLDEFREAILDAAPKRVGPKWLGVKNTCLLPELTALSVMPEVTLRVVVMLRDRGDCYASYLERYRKIYSDTQRGHLLARLNNSFMARYVAWKGLKHFIRYEDLTADPEEALSGAFKFIGLDPERYDWSAIQTVSRNSSFVGEVDAVEPNTGIVPSIGHTLGFELNTSAIKQLAEINEVARRHGYFTKPVVRQLIDDGVRAVRNGENPFPRLRQGHRPRPPLGSKRPASSGI